MLGGSRGTIRPMSEIRDSHEYYAAMLRLTGCLCVVAGGGTIASRKVVTLLKAGARVRVVSKTLDQVLTNAWHADLIEYIERPWQDGDGTDAWLIIAATDNREVNRAIAMQAHSQKQWVNVVDDPSLCTLMVPATVALDDVVIAISTRGVRPAYAKALRQALAFDVEQGTDQFIRMLQQSPEDL